MGAGSLEPQPGDSCGLGDSASALQQTCLSRPENNRLKGRDGGLVSVAFRPDGRLLASGSRDRTVQRWVASPKNWFRLGCTRLVHHPLMVNPASASSDPELIAAGKRTHQACQAANRRAERAQHQGASHGLAGLLAWARRLMP